MGEKTEQNQMCLSGPKGGARGIRALICDDDRAFAGQLERWLYDYHCSHCDGPLQIVTRWDASQVTDQELASFDLVFLDIDMEPENGIQTARRLRKLHSDAIILFVTNYIEYSPEGYEVNAFRYLLKSQWQAKLPGYYESALAALARQERRLNFQLRHEDYSVRLQDILYLESHRRLISLHLLGPHPAGGSFYATLQEMEEQLSGAGFLRIHKSYLVNMAHLKRLDCHEAVLAEDVRLPVSQRNYAAIRTTFLNWKCRQ